jgi:hypothetical protein
VAVIEDEAREAFLRGTEAAEAERWADSERAFRRAYELSGAPSALFNEAVALRALGRHVQACDAFARLLSLPREVVGDAMRAQAEHLRAESSTRVATLELAGSGLSDAEVRVDGVLLAPDVPQSRVPVDEGEHVLIVTRPGQPPFTRRVSVAGGEHARVLVPASLPGGSPRSRRARALWWIAGTVAVVAGASVAAILATRNDDEPLEPRAVTRFEVP